jgi:hypothetical protein
MAFARRTGDATDGIVITGVRRKGQGRRRRAATRIGQPASEALMACAAVTTSAAAAAIRGLRRRVTGDEMPTGHDLALSVADQWRCQAC